MDTEEAAPETTLENAAEDLGKLRQAATDTESKPEGALEATQAQEMPDASDEAHDATPDDESDTVEPTIAAPSGWNAEDQAWFETLEPARQEAILRRERGTQAAESRRQNEYSAAVKEAQAARDAAAQERQYLRTAINHYRPQLVANYERDFADLVRGETDLFRLAQNPERWSRYQAYQQSYAELAQAEQAAVRQAEADEQQRWGNFVAERNNRLVEAMPELKDPAKFQAYDNEVSNYLLGQDVPAHAIQHASFKEIQIAVKAMNWDKAQKAKANPPQQPKPQALAPGQVNVTGHIRTVPKVMRPGTSAGGNIADDKIAAQHDQLRKSGSLDDAASVLASLRSRKRA